jgi:hypothetical protein
MMSYRLSTGYGHRKHQSISPIIIGGHKSIKCLIPTIQRVDGIILG